MGDAAFVLELNATCPEAVPQAIMGQLRDYFYT